MLLICRPHGQHAVILAEDAPRYMDCRNGRNDPGAAVASSHQIYLTFPAESIFSEEDVSNYFKYRTITFRQFLIALVTFQILFLFSSTLCCYSGNMVLYVM